MRASFAAFSGTRSSAKQQLGAAPVRANGSSRRAAVLVQARKAEVGVGCFGTKAGMMTYFTSEGLAVPATVIALEEG